MTLALYERGAVHLAEWAATLGDEIKKAQAAGDPDTGETYYRHWLAALERLVAEKGVTTRDTLHRYRDAWDHACDRTPHGKPIELRAGGFRLGIARHPEEPARSAGLEGSLISPSSLRANARATSGRRRLNSPMRSLAM